MQTYCKGSPHSFFTFFTQPTKPEDSKGSPLSIFFGTVRFFSKIFNVSKESPLRMFWYFATESMLMNPKGSPRFIFRHYTTFSKFFSKKNFQKNFQNFFCFQSGKVIFQSYRAWKEHFVCLESVFKAFHEYILGIFRKLCAFWALDIAPTLDVPVLFFVTLQTSSCMYHFLSTVQFYQKSLDLIFNASKTSNLRYKTNAKQKGPPFQFFGTMRLLPPPFSAFWYVSRNFFNVSKKLTGSLFLLS